MSYPAYPEYKDSGLEHIGQIPSHWEITKLPWLVYADNAGEVIDKTYWGSGYERLYTCARKPMRSDFIGFPEKKRTARNDLLLTRNGTPYIHEPVPGAIYSNVVQRISLVPRVNRKFLRHGLDVSSKSLVGYGVSIASFNYEMWCSLRLVLPDKEEQNKIVVFLNHETARIDALVEEQQRLIELLKEKRQAVISHAVTKGLDPEVPMKDSGVEWLGEVPAHWAVGPLRWYATIQGGIAKGKSYDAETPTVELPYLRVANVQDGYIDLSTVKTVEVAVSEVDRYRLQEGDVLMNEGGDNDKLGRGTVWKGEVTDCLHQNHVFAIRPNHYLLPHWLSMFTRSDTARAYFYLYSKQSTNLASISSSSVMSCPLPLPPVQEQRQVLDFLAIEAARLDDLMQESIKTINLLQERRSALISAVVTGKIDVRGWQPPEDSMLTGEDSQMEVV